MTATPLTIGVTGLCGHDNPAPGPGVARCLRQNPHLRLIGLGIDALDPGAYRNDLFDEVHLLPYPSASADDYAERLLAIAEATGMQVVIPNLDSELPVFIALAERLAAAGLACVLPSRQAMGLRGKDRLAELAALIGLPTPPLQVLTDHTGVDQAWAELGAGLWLKGAFNGAHRADTPAAAHAAFNQIVAEWGYPVVAQAPAFGEAVNLVGLADGHGGLIGQVAMKKLVSSGAGKAWVAVTIDHPELLAAGQRFAERSGWRGPFELELLSQANGDLALLEINPRFPAWTGLCAGIEVDLPGALVELALGRTPPPFAPAPAGKLWVRHCTETVCDLDQFQHLVTGGVTRLEGAR